jgi:hypothetical protein
MADNEPQGSSNKPLAEQALERCVRIVEQVNRFKQPRIERIQLYRDLYAGKIKKKFRQPFNVHLPVFAGAMDTLMAAFNDDLALEFREQEPADYLQVRKLNSLWTMETSSVAPNAKFALKCRQDRSNALFSGRGFMVNYAISDPSYRNVFEIYELEDAIFQPRGGGHLQSHLYNGRQNIIRSASELKSGPYDQTQVAKLLKLAAKTDFYPSDSDDTRQALAKFKAMGLATENSDYVGEQLFKLVEMRITMNGVRYYIVFSPWYKVWVRFAKFSEVFSADIDPWISWATHEDNKNFLSKSYADDLYGIADAVHTLFNQELTNREKRNFNARGYDVEMFPDVAKLDLAQTRPDALVPIKVPPGKRVEDGIFTFETAELQGTINLIDWMQQTSGIAIGVTDTSMGGSENVSKKATVVFAEQQNINKRLLLRSSSYTEGMAEVGKLFIQGCKDHLPAKKAIRLLGADGQGWEEITRADLDLYSDVDVKVVSSSIEMKNSQLKKEARMKVLTDIAANPILAPQVNPRWTVEELLRSGGEYEDNEIKLALDTKNYGNKEEVAHAHAGIQAILSDEKPDLFYGATTLFMQIVVDFATDNRSTLGLRKYAALMDYATAHQSIVQENMARKAQQDAATLAQNPQPGPTAPAPPMTAGGLPSPATQVRQVAASLP